MASGVAKDVDPGPKAWGPPETLQEGQIHGVLVGM